MFRLIMLGHGLLEIDFAKRGIMCNWWIMQYAKWEKYAIHKEICRMENISEVEIL